MDLTRLTGWQVEDQGQRTGNPTPVLCFRPDEDAEASRREEECQVPGEYEHPVSSDSCCLCPLPSNSESVHRTREREPESHVLSFTLS